MPSRVDDLITNLMGGGYAAGSLSDREVARLRALVGAGSDKLSLNDLYRAAATVRRIK